MTKSCIKAYGYHRNKPKGWIAKVGEDNYFHRFGGKSWKLIDPKLNDFTPTLLLVFDLNDPRLGTLNTAGIDELPLCSHIDCSVWDGKQVFQIDPQSKSVILIEREIYDIESWETGFPQPLPEKRLKLYPMDDTDYPIDEEQYKQAIEKFLTTSFIRVLGSPLWMDIVLAEEDENPRCNCGLSMQYVCAIGQQNELNEQYLDNELFYIGEGVLYFFFCQKCLQITVVSQSV